MNTSNAKLHYLKNVLGIKSLIVPEGYHPRAIENDSRVELAYQTFSGGNVLFLGKGVQKNFSIEEMQLLEKIIVALKLKFEKTDIANVKCLSKVVLVKELLQKSYSYVFLLGDDIHSLFRVGINSEFEENGIKFFSTFHPSQMIENPDLKKEAWAGFKSIMESIPR